MILCNLSFVIVLCMILQSNGNICTIDDCKQNSRLDVLEENLTLVTRLPNCIMTRNYDGLYFSIVLENNTYQSCSWIYADNFINSNRTCVDYNRINANGASPFKQENIFTSLAHCANRSSSRTNVRETTCVMNNRRHYSSIVFESISSNDFFVSVQCDGKYTEGFHIRVRRCNTTFGEPENPVIVDLNGNDRSYNAIGSFRCINYGTLFYSNETLVQDYTTRCLETAEWKGQKDLQCLKVPQHPLQQDPCVWNLNEYGSCRVEFFSNPDVRSVSLFRDGTDITNSSVYSLSVLKNHLHVFTLNVSQATKDDSAIYQLFLKWNSIKLYSSINFSIIVPQNILHPASPGSNICSAVFWVGGFGGAGICVLAIILTIKAKREYLAMGLKPNNTKLGKTSIVDDNNRVIERLDKTIPQAVYEM